MVYSPNCGRPVEKALPQEPPAQQENAAPLLAFSDLVLMNLTAKVPVLGLIMCIIWALSKDNPDRTAWAKARLLGTLLSPLAYAACFFVFTLF